MHETLARLIDADEKLPVYYRRVRNRWSKILRDELFEDVDGFAQSLHHHQHGFEEDCESVALGKEVMAIVGIMQFHDYRWGWQDIPANLKRALFVLEAIEKSSCSVEVKSAAKRIARFDGLDDYRDKNEDDDFIPPPLPDS